MAPNAYGTDGIMSPYATGGYPMHAPNATSYMNTPSQVSLSCSLASVREFPYDMPRRSINPQSLASATGLFATVCS